MHSVFKSVLWAASLSFALSLFSVARAGETNAAANKPKAEPGAAPEQRAMRRMVDDPGLPRVLLIGDSISVGYTEPVQTALKGIANVHRIPENGATTTNGLARIDVWLGTNRWDMIHFNWGLHDIKLNPDDANWVPLDAYGSNLEQLVKRMKQTGARLVFATTTPVPVSDKLNPKRRSQDVERYNATAKGIMLVEGVAINDLYTLALPNQRQWQLTNNVHFTTNGSVQLGNQVAAIIKATVKKR